MATVTVNIVDGGSARICYDKNGAKAWELNRIAVVSGLSAGTKQDILAEAITALIDVVGDIGSEEGTYPTRPTAHITEFQPENESDTVVRVRIVYKDYLVDLGRIEVGAAISQVETNRWWDGTRIAVGYTYSSSYAPDPRGVAGTTVNPPQGGRTTKLAPEATVRLCRKEYGSPLVKATQYVGTMNDNTFMALPAKRWLCTKIQGISEDRIWFDVEYEFQAREDTWDNEVGFINPDDGMVPSDAVEGNGILRVQVQKMMNFTNLNL